MSLKSCPRIFRLVLASVMFFSPLVGADEFGRLEQDVRTADADQASGHAAATLDRIHTLRLTPSRATTAESESNDSSATADTLTLNSDRGTGDLAPAGDRDWWTASGVSVGDLLFVLLSSHLSSGKDTELRVFEDDAVTLIEYDNDSADDGSAVAAIVPTAGSIYLELNEEGDDGTIEPYDLFVAAVAPGSAVAETEPNDARTIAGSNPLPGIVATGDLSDMTDDVFHFFATAGQRIGVVMNNDPDTNGSNTHASLSIHDPDQVTQIGGISPFSVVSQTAASATAVSTGIHYVTVSRFGGDTYSLAVFLEDALVPVELLSFAVE